MNQKTEFIKDLFFINFRKKKSSFFFLYVKFFFSYEKKVFFSFFFLFPFSFEMKKFFSSSKRFFQKFWIYGFLFIFSLTLCIFIGILDCYVLNIFCSVCGKSKGEAIFPCIHSTLSVIALSFCIGVLFVLGIFFLLAMPLYFLFNCGQKKFCIKDYKNLLANRGDTTVSQLQFY